LLVFALALGFAFTPVQNSSAEDASPKCDCAYPNTGEYGVKNGTDCEVKRCWVDVQ
jgi:hypothetical protein